MGELVDRDESVLRIRETELSFFDSGVLVVILPILSICYQLYLEELYLFEYPRSKLRG